ncbi:isochorismatase family protein [Bacillus sp. 1P06AnD]|uniref:isochorismatase family protein n=1 Tax=Bacillus sp. 1P06AnD TaxID=3132208 RepID=UPI0039A14BA8
MTIDFKKTALVIIDLQKGIVGLSPEGSAIVGRAAKLADVFRREGGFIANVHVDFLDGRDKLDPATDYMANSSTAPADWSDFVPELKVGKGDYVVTKRQWGAFFGTDLDLQLRRRGIDTIVLCGIATNIGVETTAREAFQYGYNQIFITDAMATFSKEEHEATCVYIFPKIGKVRTLEAFLAEIEA